MDQQAEPAKRALALQPGDDVVGQPHPLEGLAEHELARVEDERLVVADLDQLGQVLHRLAHVDVGVAGVVEDAELAVDPHVDARRLDQLGIEGVEDDPPGLDLLPDRAVAQDHRGESIARLKALGRGGRYGGEMAERQTDTEGDAQARLPLERESRRRARTRGHAAAAPAARAHARRPPRLPRLRLGARVPDRLGARRLRSAGDVALRCPECEWTGGGDLRPGRRSIASTRRSTAAPSRSSTTCKLLVRSNMEEEIERFVAALRADHILPEDF